jgi:hypothetical protein
MTVTRVATANYNSVCASLECAENKHRVNSARAGNTNDLNFRGVIKTVVAGKVCTGIRTPVTAECHN